MKVFCKDCKHGNGRYKEEYKCYHPKNLTYDWYSVTSIHLKSCSELNKDNSCDWFEL